MHARLQKILITVEVKQWETEKLPYKAGLYITSYSISISSASTLPAPSREKDYFFF